jgi:HTH-type transcriptional regulator/antitoxin HigA
MSDIKPIRNRDDYNKAVALLADLIEASPADGTPEDTKIRVLTNLIEDFENATLPDYEVDPIEAIKLRMDQLGLKDKDLVDYFGSRSRVSEVLSGKRALTVPMIKNVEEGLGIPASILVGSSVEKRTKRWSPKTLTIMAQRGYFGQDHTDLEPNKILDMGLLKTLFSGQSLASTALLRQTNYRDISNIDKYHMEAWTSKVLSEAQQIIRDNNVAAYNKNDLSEERLSELFKLSSQPNGVNEVISALRKLGIIVVIEPHLPSTRLDGATLFTDDNVVIGLTIRFDRLDNFWFTLAHELAHAYLHSESDYSAFFDQLFNEGAETSQLENEADALAGELLIPTDTWKASSLRYGSTPTLVKIFADKIGVHPSVIAGRIRHDSKDWSVHSDIVNDEKVRHLFEGKLW